MNISAKFLNAHCSMFNSHLSKYPGVSQGVPSRLRIHAKPVRALSDWNFRDEMAVIGIDGIDLGVVSAGKPEHFAIGGDPAHVRASAAGQLPFLDDALGLEVDERNTSFSAILLRSRNMRRFICSATTIAYLPSGV